LGIGATTSAADSQGAHPGGQVVDANYIRILADLGFIGFASFLMILFFVLIKSLKLKNGFAYLSIIAIYCMQALGTNIFDSQYVVHIFWLLLGFIDSDRDMLYNPRKIK